MSWLRTLETIGITSNANYGFRRPESILTKAGRRERGLVVGEGTLSKHCHGLPEKREKKCGHLKGKRECFTRSNISSTFSPQLLFFLPSALLPFSIFLLLSPSLSVCLIFCISCTPIQTYCNLTHSLKPQHESERRKLKKEGKKRSSNASSQFVKERPSFLDIKVCVVIGQLNLSQSVIAR